MLMIHGICPDTRDKLRPTALGPGDAFPADAVWIDLLNPTPEEDKRVEKHLGISIPTREEMHDLEPSEIIYTENGARYMTARIICMICSCALAGCCATDMAIFSNNTTPDS